MCMAASCRRLSPYFTAAPGGDKEHRGERLPGRGRGIGERRGERIEEERDRREERLEERREDRREERSPPSP